MSSLKHILADEPVEEHPRPAPPTPSAPPPPALAETPSAQLDDSIEDVRMKTDESREDGDTPQYTATTQTTRRNANGSVSSVYSGNKIRHLKKEDGIPLWRKDIQYDFLCLVFYNEQKVFTRYSDGKEGFTFAEIYVDAMSKSSKCSKILKEKLAADVPSAIIMAMVCLLVNVGRMNTTLNFFPEMRAQLRTYHSIPALQAKQDPNAYKQLQDAPRLKSILKGATEDSPQPGTIEDIKAAKKPRTNPVNLIFVLAQYAPKISELHFTPPRDFFDLVMRPTLSSKSRAGNFLWLMWHYLESDFTYEGALKNPFGLGKVGPGSGGMPIKLPELEALTEEEAERENVDTMSEEEFGDSKRRERTAIVASEPSPAMTALKRARKAERGFFSAGGEGSEGVNTPGRDLQSPAPYGSVYSQDGQGDRQGAGSDHTRSPSPPASGFQAINRGPRSSGMGVKPMLSEDDAAMNPPPAAMPKKGPGRGNWRRNKEQPILPSPSFGFVHESPAPHTPAASNPRGSPVGSVSFPPLTLKDHVPTTSFQSSSKRNRPLTTHQQVLSDHRRTRVNNILDMGYRTRLTAAKRRREDEGVFLQAWKRIKMLPDGWDSEDEGLEKAKEDSKDKDKDKDDSSKNKLKEDEKAAAALRKAAGGAKVYGGFRLPMTDKDLERERSRDIFVPDPDDEDDFGEQALYQTESLGRYCERIEKWEEIENSANPFKEAPEPKRPFQNAWEKEDIEIEPTEFIAASTPRPRQTKKKSGPTAGARKPKSKASAKTAKNGTKEEDGTEAAAANADEDEPMGEGDETVGEVALAGDVGELDDDDRELLGEADGDDSEDEDEGDEMDED